MAPPFRCLSGVIHASPIPTLPIFPLFSRHLHRCVSLQRSQCKAGGTARAQSLHAYCNARVACRRAILLEYFDEGASSAGASGAIASSAGASVTGASGAIASAAGASGHNASSAGAAGVSLPCCDRCTAAAQSGHAALPGTSGAVAGVQSKQKHAARKVLKKHVNIGIGYRKGPPQLAQQRQQQSQHRQQPRQSQPLQQQACVGQSLNVLQPPHSSTGKIMQVHKHGSGPGSKTSAATTKSSASASATSNSSAVRTVGCSGVRRSPLLFSKGVRRKFVPPRKLTKS
jgi:hypothetical protein